MSSLPSGEVIRNGIKAALASLAVDTVRSNKLRKMVCKSVEGCTWTQFQVHLDDLVKSGKLKVVTSGKGEIHVLVSSLVGGNALGGTAHKEETTIDSEKSTTCLAEETKVVLKKLQKMEIPHAVAKHLVRKGRKKQKNIEKSTKVLLTMSGMSDAKEPSDTVVLNISREYPTSVEEEKAEAQLNAAKMLIGNMVNAYEKHPDRFLAKRDGGTFEEQAKAREIKEAGYKRRRTGKKHLRPTAAGPDRKRQRKFY
jgi:hypothetical protein